MASDGRVAVVTGAAQGIGYAISDRLLQEGYRVCLADVNKEKGQESLDELQKKYAADKLIYVECDVTSEASFQETFSRAQEAFGRIDLLVNNAGIADEYNPQRTVAINLMGPIIGSQLALKFMGTSNGGKGGVVVSVASIAGLLPAAHLPVYTATKHGVVGLTRAYGNHYHLDQNGVIFMAICPYYVKTDLLQTSRPLNVVDDPGVKNAMQPDFVAEGVSKLLQDRHNGSTMLVMPGKQVYIEMPDEIKKINP